MASRKEYELALKIGARVDKSVNSSVSNIEKRLGSMSEIAAKAAGGIGAAFAAVKVGQFISEAVETYKDYQSAISETAAIAGTSANDGTGNYEKLEKAAREAGRATTKTAEESAQALGYMALAGWNVDDSVSALQPILKMSTATNAELAYTSDLVTDSMANLGLGIDDLNHYLDVSIQANNKSNQTAIQLQEAYLGVGGTFKNLKAPIEESAALLGVLANRGTKGSEAGTAMSAILVNMQKKTGDSAKAMKQLKVSMFDAKGNARSLIDVFQEINDKTAGMTTEQKQLIYQMIGGKSHLDSFSKIMAGFSDETADGKKEVYSLRDALYDSDGALERFYEVKTGTLGASMEILNSAVDDFKISLAERFAPAATKAINHIAERIPELTDKVSEGVERIAPRIESTVDYVIDNSDEILKKLEGAAKVGAAIWATDKVVKFGSTAAKVGGAVSKAIPLMSTKAAASISAVGATAVGAAGGVAAVGAAVFAAELMMEQAHKKSITANLEKHFGDIALALEDTEEAARFIVDNKNLEKINSILSKDTEIKKYSDSIKEITKNLNKAHWKVSLGMNLTEEEKQSYISDIEDYINNVQKQIESEHFKVKAAVSLMTDDVEITNGLDSFYNKYENDLKSLGTQLKDAVNEAFDDGLLEIDETEKISQLQQQMADIQTKLTQSRMEGKLESLKLNFSGAELTSESYKELSDKISDLISESKSGIDETYEIAISNAYLRYAEGDIDDTEYQRQLSEFKQKRLEQLGDIELRANQFKVNTLFDSFSNEISENAKGLADVFENEMNNQAERMRNGGEFNLTNFSIAIQDSMKLDKTQRGTLNDIYQTLKPEQEKLIQLANDYREAGKAIPEAIQKGITDNAAIGAMAGDLDSLSIIIGTQFSASPQWTDLLMQCQNMGVKIPQSILKGVEISKGIVGEGAEKIFGNIGNNLPETINRNEQLLKKYYDNVVKPIDNTQINLLLGITDNATPILADTEKQIDDLNRKKKIQIDIQTRVREIRETNDLAQKWGIQRNAGGTSYADDIFLGGEEAPELVRPIHGDPFLIGLNGPEIVSGYEGAAVYNGSETRSMMNRYTLRTALADVEKLERDRRPVGAEKQSESSPSFVYSPEIHIQGTVSESEFRNTMSLSYDDFVKMAERYVRDKQRKEFSR